MIFRRKMHVAASLFAVALVLASCGGGSEDLFGEVAAPTTAPEEVEANEAAANLIPVAITDDVNVDVAVIDESLSEDVVAEVQDAYMGFVGQLDQYLVGGDVSLSDHATGDVATDAIARARDFNLGRSDSYRMVEMVTQPFLLEMRSSGDGVLVKSCDEAFGKNAVGYGDGGYVTRTVQMVVDDGAWKVAAYESDEDPSVRYEARCVPPLFIGPAKERLAEFLEAYDASQATPQTPDLRLEDLMSKFGFRDVSEYLDSLVEDGIYGDNELIHHIRVRSAGLVRFVSLEVCSELPEGITLRSIETGEVVRGPEFVGQAYLTRFSVVMPHPSFAVDRFQVDGGRVQSPGTTSLIDGCS